MQAEQVIILINFILQVIQMLDHSLFRRIKNSKCICGEIQLDNDKKDNNDIEKNNNKI